MLPFALAIFTGAFLLFQVEPLIGKYILPWFGGAPGVWTTCLLFFQIALLAGYAYAHWLTSRLNARRQLLLHGVLLVAAIALLPIAPGDYWKAHIAGNPTWHVLLLLAGTIGLPFFVLSATGPLVQQWFTLARPGASPYRLYALSNLGSLLALLSYPTYFEVQFSRFTQAALWSAGFVVFGVLCLACGAPLWGSEPRQSESNRIEPNRTESSREARGAEEQAPSAADKVLWVALPATASVLLLATTNKLCLDLAVIPLLWVLPLSLYLLSFVICFDHARWYPRAVVAALLVIGVALVFEIMPNPHDVPLSLQIGVYAATLFVACLFCHGELYQLRPPPRYLTAFYLAVAAGGALGGVLVAVVAPLVFTDFHELAVGLWALSYLVGVMAFRRRSLRLAFGAAAGALLAMFVLPVVRSRFSDGLTIVDEWTLFFRHYGWFIAGGIAIFVGCALDARTRRPTRRWQPRLGGFLMALSVVVGLVVVVQWRSDDDGRVVDAVRNFYGVLKVEEFHRSDPEQHYFLLMHGATLHGLQFTADDKAMVPTTYYGLSSGLGRAMENLPVPPGRRRIGIVGLGTGTTAAYAQAGDYVRFYDINPAVVKLARTRFTYLRRCPAKIDIVLGDARLSMEHELAAGAPQRFDILVLDAFSSDAIPIHLLTKEAFAIYLRELKPAGVLAVHTSNRYLNLRPVVERLAAEDGLRVAFIDDAGDDKNVYATTWMLVTRNQPFLDQPEINAVAQWPVDPPETQPLWTDDHAGIFQVLR